MKDWFRSRLAERSVAGNDLDAPETTVCHGEMIRRKPILRAFYEDVYAHFLDQAQELPDGVQLELGSGGGFLKDRLPDVVTSDVLPLPNVDLPLDALDMPFDDATVSAVYMLDVLHHLPDVGKFLDEAQRCLAPRGRIVMVEPANTVFGRFVYQNFHHEPFLPDAPDWTLPEGGPMSVANGALPWIVFVRDLEVFQARYPQLRIRALGYWAPFRYLASGGVSMHQLVPIALFPVVLFTEWLLSPLNAQLGMFMRITVEKLDAPGKATDTANANV